MLFRLEKNDWSAFADNKGCSQRFKHSIPLSMGRSILNDSSEKEAKSIIVKMLARREHSQQELRQRLQQKGFADTVIDATLEAAETAGWQSDERYTLAFARSRIERQQGPAKIRAELRQRGIASALAAHCLEQLEPDWDAMALTYVQRHTRFQQAPLKARQALQRRGFDSSQINHAMREWELLQKDDES